MAKMDNVVEAFSDEEMEDYAAVFIQIISNLCRFADKYNYDRDNIVKYAAQHFSVFAEITTVENFSLKERPTIEAEHEWISVKDRLPEQYAVVIVYDGEQVGEAEFNGVDFGWVESEDLAFATHWMPFPEPPETK